ncbi:MAG: hypothetical protein Q8K00_01035 [Syntrophales bacterium]|nr:hypothetical protein [Syntrophales bacterium]
MMTAADMTARKPKASEMGLPPDHLDKPAVTVPRERKSEGYNPSL